ncbi:DUF6327 family protein [Fluviicola chungangensis]|uniref:Uncharacterized protein n=1 Tax=Fluviicola chungangensis TaxID=2597671 RepID=A0A556N331_9FLAO|nr:DUF6327 family protein [Fluviicola chungangensis]TSJ46483.1 hypothetical protein FO442_04810 [Fluviicola chungangensis]
MERKQKIYSSFEEIELDLQILKVQREIHAQKIKLNLEKTGENLQPINLLQDYIGESNRNTFSLIEQVIKLILQFVIKPFKE